MSVSFFSHLAIEDYTSTITLLTFGPDTPNVQVTVPVVDDSVAEPDETFFGNLRIPLGEVLDTISILYQPGRATATIQDNDCKLMEYHWIYVDTCVVTT